MDIISGRDSGVSGRWGARRGRDILIGAEAIEGGRRPVVKFQKVAKDRSRLVRVFSISVLVTSGEGRYVCRSSKDRGIREFCMVQTETERGDRERVAEISNMKN